MRIGFLILIFLFIAACGEDTDSKPSAPSNAENNQNSQSNNVNNTNPDMGEPDAGRIAFSIVGASVEPSSLTLAETGMTDEFITIEVAYIGADELDLLRSGVAYLDGPAAVQAGAEKSQSPGQAVFTATNSWFAQAEPGTYDIVVELVSVDGVIARETGLVSITISP